MLITLILGLMAIFALGIFLLQRNQVQRTTHRTYFSQTLGVSDPVRLQAKDESSAR